MSDKHKKAFIIGLDGSPWSLLREYVKNGVMLNLKDILENGYALQRMDASLPEISSVSWTTFATGVNPGEHGIFGFAALIPHTYSLYFSNSQYIKTPVFWEMLGGTVEGKNSSLYELYKDKIKDKYRSIVINIPHTYPAYPINGILISGFVATSLKKAVFPKGIARFLNSIKYAIDVDVKKVHHDKDGFLEDIFKSFEIRKTAIRYFINNEDWDIFVVAITEIDRLHHFFYEAALDEGNLYNSRFIEFYNKIDLFIKEMFDIFQQKSAGQGFFMMLSDHGFAPVRKQVYLNTVFQKEGLLCLDESGEYYEGILERTKAFCMDPGRIYVNTKGCYPRGCVEEHEKEEVLREAKEVLLNLKHKDGAAVIKKIYSNKEIYHGPASYLGPDLVCLAHDGFALRANTDRKEIFSDDIFTGMHTYEDAVCVLPSSIKVEEKLSIEQLADFVLRYFIV